LIQTVLWIAQRVTGALLGVCVVVHLATIIYAVRGGLTAAEILGRTRGNVGWLAFYSLFVIAAAVHAPIGLRELALIAFSIFLFLLGMRAVLAVFA
jgi:fumarate reductase subunit C